MHAFDGQTEAQTDRILIARPRLHSMQRGKNQAFRWKNAKRRQISVGDHCSAPRPTWFFPWVLEPQSTHGVGAYYGGC